MTPRQGPHCALRLSKWYVRYSVGALKQNASQPAFRERQKCLSALVTVEPGRRRIRPCFIGGKLTIAGKPFATLLRLDGQISTSGSQGRAVEIWLCGTIPQQRLELGYQMLSNMLNRSEQNLTLTKWTQKPLL